MFHRFVSFAERKLRERAAVICTVMHHQRSQLFHWPTVWTTMSVERLAMGTCIDMDEFDLTPMLLWSRIGYVANWRASRLHITLKRCASRPRFLRRCYALPDVFLCRNQSSNLEHIHNLSHQEAQQAKYTPQQQSRNCMVDDDETQGTRWTLGASSQG